MTAYANVNGETVIQGTLRVPNIGPWWAEVVFEGAPDIADGARVTLNLGALALSGTVDAGHNGVFGEQRRTRIVAGANGWGDLLAAKHYHNDAGVLALAVAQDAAREVGETLGAFEATAAKVGVDYARQSGAAARALEDAAGGAAWWINQAGETIVGTRAAVDAPTDAYEVLECQPGEGLVTLAVDDLSQVWIGSTFSTGLAAPLTAFEIKATISPDNMRVVVWGGGTAGGRGRLAGLIVAAVEAVTRRRLFGRYRYRVVEMSADRVKLQAVVSRPGLPDVLPISQKPGVAGAHAKLAGGSIVLVEFLEGDRTLPIVTAYAGKGEEGHAPTELDLSVVSTLRLGSDAATEGVALGSSLKSWLDTHVHDVGTYANGSGAVTGLSGVASSAPATPDPSPAPSSKVLVE